MKKKSKPEASIDIDLITLAYCLLAYKSRTTHKKYTIVDLLQTCEDILKESEKIHNQHSKEIKFRFVDDKLEIYSEELARILRAPLGVL